MTLPLLSRRMLLGASTLLLTGARGATEPFVYLLPAPREAIVFAPLVLAEGDGLFAREGLAVRFEQVAGGGMKVGEALAAGKGDAGGALGDTALILRARDVRVKGVALLGRHSFLTLIEQASLPVAGRSLKGRQIGVPSLQDVSYYALKALLRNAGLTPGDVQVLAAPSGTLVEKLGTGELAAIVGTIDWGVKAERAGVALRYRPLDRDYPAVAQGIMASDATIAGRPDALRRFVRAVLNAIDGIVRNPDTAAARYARLAPQSGFSEVEAARIFRLLACNVYGRRSGRFDPTVMAAAARAATQEGLVSHGTDVHASFSNQFVTR
ncbi:ABC transporter substrate-binding protein [Sphingomonas sp.]|uniref:ABC transporter substrate-binding protein n=1 Tax=Sphingomonas sp. TaxID=28214 RepID=UPI003BAC2F18